MIPTLKAEFRKLLSIRSTYIITLFVTLLVGVLSVWVFGYLHDFTSITSPDFMGTGMFFLIGTAVMFVAIVSILSVTHEYRYNMISYTLTASKSRVRVLAAKAVVVTTYALVIGTLLTVISYFGMKIGLAMSGTELVSQNLSFGSIVWQYSAYLVGYALVGLIIGVLVRSVVGAIVAFFLIPVAEQTLQILLKDNADFLPFRSLDSIPSSMYAGTQISSLTSLTALGVFSIYLVVIGGLAVYFFVKRDAN